jgi:cytochrome c oxidase subunit IV
MAEKEDTAQIEDELEAKKRDAYRVGLGVFFLLVVFSIGEYWLGTIASAWWAPILAIATLKAVLVVRDYMHIGRLFANEEEAH